MPRLPNESRDLAWHVLGRLTIVQRHAGRPSGQLLEFGGTVGDGGRCHAAPRPEPRRQRLRDAKLLDVSGAVPSLPEQSLDFVGG
jgi:hypothetical protein